jgi:hypothetical protein
MQMLATFAPGILAEIQAFIDSIPWSKKVGLVKFANAKPSDVTVEMLGEIIKSFGREASESNLRSAAEIIQSDNPDTLGDYLSKDGNLQKIVGVIMGHKPQLTTVIDEVTGDVSEVRFMPVVCPICDGCFEHPVA